MHFFHKFLCVGALIVPAVINANCLEIYTQQEHVHVAKVDLNCKDIQILGTEVDERGISVSEFARRHQTAVAINGGFFKSGYLPFGLAVTKGQVWPQSQDLKTRTFFACDKDNRCVIEDGNTLSAPDKRWYTAVSGWQFFNRETVRFECAQTDTARCRSDKFASKQPRTMIGMDDGNQLFLIVVDGRLKHFQGMTLDELAQLAHTLKLQKAINLDGGGSSAMVVGNRRISTLPEKQAQERAVANHLGIVWRR